MIEWHSLSIFKHKSGAVAPVDYLSTFATAPFILLPDSSRFLYCFLIRGLLLKLFFQFCNLAVDFFQPGGILTNLSADWQGRRKRFPFSIWFRFFGYHS